MLAEGGSVAVQIGDCVLCFRYGPPLKIQVRHCGEWPALLHVKLKMLIERFILAKITFFMPFFVGIDPKMLV